MTPAEEGVIRVDGKSVTIDSPSAAKHLGIAYVPEDRGRQGLVRPLPLAQNVSLASLRRVSRKAFINRRSENSLAQDSVKQLHIRASGIGQIVGKLSGGNQQKVGLSKWLATEPRILIMDEPTRGIDVGAKAEIHRLMGELAGKGMAIIMISSELPEVLGMSDRILVMRGGRIVAEVARGEATQAGIAAAMMSDAPAERLEAA
jgi:ABC-type sugar transport system ATPase subunit